MTTNSAVKGILDRILRLKEQQDEIGEDIKDIYAEAKSNGWNKTCLGNAITSIRKRQKDPQKFEEQDSETELYLAAFYGSGTLDATRTHAGEAEPPRAHIVREVAPAPKSAPATAPDDDLEIPEMLRRT